MQYKELNLLQLMNMASGTQGRAHSSCGFMHRVQVLVYHCVLLTEKDGSYSWAGDLDTKNDVAFSWVLKPSS